MITAPSATAAAGFGLDQAAIDQYTQTGFCVLPGVLSAAELNLLRQAADQATDAEQARLRAAGVAAQGINQHDRLFIIFPHRSQPQLLDFALGQRMSAYSQVLLGANASLFWEQFVVKEAGTGGAFSWHQDSAYVEYEHPPYLTCWVALDAVSQVNGSVHVLSYQRAGTRDRIAHWRDERTHDLIGYDGPDRGELVVGPAGTIALFSSHVLHSSGPNTSPSRRRVYLAQYSAGPVVGPQGQKKGICLPVRGDLA